MDYVRQGQAMTADWANSVINELRSIQSGTKKTVIIPKTTPQSCPFGKIVAKKVGEVYKYFIQGGLVTAGNKNYNVDDFELPNMVMDKIYYFEIPVTVNMDDDSEILMPHVKTSSWTPNWEEADATDDYPDTTNPTIPTGNGTAIVPLGRVTITNIAVEGQPPIYARKMVAVSCGAIIVTHCSGSLGFVRI